MHWFMMGALVHTLGLGVLAFFVLFAASKADGFVKLLGNILGYLLLLVAVAGLAVGGYCAATGHWPMGHENGKWMMRIQEGDDKAPPAATTAAPPAKASPDQKVKP